MKKNNPPIDKSKYDFFGRNILALLEKANATQTELAERINVSNNTVSSWVNFHYPHGLIQMCALIEFFYERIPDFSPTDLFLDTSGLSPNDSLASTVMKEELRRAKRISDEEYDRRKTELETQIAKYKEKLDNDYNLRVSVLEEKRKGLDRLIDNECERRTKQYKETEKRLQRDCDILKKQVKDFKRIFTEILNINEEQFNQSTGVLDCFDKEMTKMLGEFLLSTRFLDLLSRTLRGDSYIRYMPCDMTGQECKHKFALKIGQDFCELVQDYKDGKYLEKI